MKWKPSIAVEWCWDERGSLGASRYGNGHVCPARVQGVARFHEQAVEFRSFASLQQQILPSSTIEFKMRVPLLATALAVVGLSAAHNIQLKAHSRECFHEQLHVDDKMTVTFQVGDREFGGSGNLDIDFWVHSFSVSG